MAFDYFADDEEKDKKGTGGTGANQNQQVGGMVEKPLGEESPVVTGNAKPAGSDGAPTSSGSFTNLQKYLDVNAGLNQGGRVAGKTQEEVDAANNAQSQADSGFKQAVDSNSVKVNSGLIDQVKTDPTKFFGQTKDTSLLQRPPISTKPQILAAPEGSTPPTVPPPVGPGGPSYSTPKVLPPPKITTLPRLASGSELGNPAPSISGGPVIGSPSKLAAELGTPGPQPLTGNADYDAFVKMRDAKYGGPQSLVDVSELYNPAQQKTAAAQEVANATSSDGGRKALLDKYFGAGAGRFDYNEGQKKLDNLLISQDPTAKAAFQQVRDNNSASQTNFENLKAALGDYAAKGAADTADARAQSRDVLGINDAGDYNNSGQIASSLAGIDQSVADRKAELAREQSVLAGTHGVKDLNQLTPEQRALMGDFNPAGSVGANNIHANDTYNSGYNVDAGYGYNVDPSLYAQYVPEGDLNRGTVGSSQDMARIDALSKLANLNQTFIPNESDAGKYASGNLSQYDQGRFLNDVNASKSGYTQEMQNLLNWEKSQGGLINAGDFQKSINNIRERWGLPRTGSEKGAVGPGMGSGPLGGSPQTGNPSVSPIGPIVTPNPPPTNYNPGSGVGYTNPITVEPPKRRGPIGGGTGPAR